MGNERKRTTFKLDLAGVSRGRVAFGEIGGKGVFVSVAKVGEILKEVNDHRGMVWVEADLVPNPEEEKREKTPYALLSSGEIYSVAKGKKPEVVATLTQTTDDTEVVPRPEPIDEELQSEPVVEVVSDGDQPKTDVEQPVKVPEVRPDQLVAPLGGGAYRIHGTLEAFLEMVIEVLGETKDNDPEVRRAGAILLMEFGYSPERLTGEMSRLRRKARAKRLAAMVDFLIEAAGPYFCHLFQVADTASTVADLAVAEYPEAMAALAEFLGIQGQGDVASLALVEDTASNSAT